MSLETFRIVSPTSWHQCSGRELGPGVEANIEYWAYWGHNISILHVANALFCKNKSMKLNESDERMYIYILFKIWIYFYFEAKFLLILSSFKFTLNHFWEAQYFPGFPQNMNCPECLSDAALFLTLCETDLEITKVQMKIWSRG